MPWFASAKIDHCTVPKLMANRDVYFSLEEYLYLWFVVIGCCCWLWSVCLRSTATLKIEAIVEDVVDAFVLDAFAAAT